MTKFLEKHLLFIFPLIFFIFVRYGYQFNGLYGQDAHRYFTYSQELIKWFFENEKLGYFIWPLAFPLIGGFIGELIGNYSLSLQIISSIGLSLAVYYTYELIDVKKKKENLIPYFFLTLLLSPIMLKHGVLIMSDMLCLAGVMGAWNFSFKYQKTALAKYVFFTAFFAGLSIMSRYVAAILLIIPAYWIVKTAINKKQWINLLYGLLIISAVISPHFIIKSSSTSFLNHSWLQDWNFLNLFRSKFSTIEGNFNYTLPNIFYIFYAAFHPLFFFLGGILVFFIKFKKDFLKRWYIWVGVILYLFFIGGIPYQNKRFLLLAVPFISLLFAPAFGRLYKIIKERLKLHLLFTVVIVFLQLGFFTYTFKNVYELNRIEIQMANYIKGFEQKNIYGFGIDIALKSYISDKTFENLWEKEYTHFKRNSLVVFNEDKFALQWENKNPMINWKRMNELYEIRKIKTFSGGWTLYELR